MVEKKPRSLAKKIFLGLGYTLLGTVLLLMAIGFWFGGGSASFVQSGNRLPQEFVRMAQEVGALSRGEKPIFYYSAELEPLDEFIMITESRISHYGQDFDLPLTTVLYKQIADARLFRNTDFFEDSQLQVDLQDGGRLLLLVSSEKDGDVRVHEYILEQIAESRAQQEDMKQKLQKAAEVEKEREADHARKLEAQRESEQNQ